MPADNLVINLQNEELVSDEIREIVSYRPHWIIRKGNIVFLMILILLIILAYIIQYPDMVNASARLVALNPSKVVNAKREGKIIQLFAENEQTVKKDQHLGFIESTASYNEVMILYKWTQDILHHQMDLHQHHPIQCYHYLMSMIY